MMKRKMKKAAKFAGVICAATGVVALSSVVASSAAVIAVKEGFKTAKATMKRLMDEQKEAELFADETTEPEIVMEPAPAEAKNESQEKIAN